MPLLFLSHAGADTEAALALTRAIEEAPDAQAAGLKVWLDKRDLVPGREWQVQLEGAIRRKATAFAVLVDSRGVINWVEREVRLALSRATSEPTFPFVPLLVGEAKSRDLPDFAQQYQAARGATATDPELLRGLLRAVLQPEDRDFSPVLESHPFVGLRAFGEGEARLFFGREQETEELVLRLGTTPLIMVVGDSGSGKSSLVKAGLVPAFRGGAMADLGGDQPDPRSWHVVTMRPRGSPFAGLTEAVVEAAQRAGRSLADIDNLRQRIRRQDAASIRDALSDVAPSPKLVLLVIDQFEELWTQASDAERRAFVEVVAELRSRADRDLRLVLTMRRDYYNLVSEFPGFFAQLEAPDGKAKFVTRRMQNEALRKAILEPLKLSVAKNEAAAEIFAERVLRDAGDRPGDLALVQMALAEAWRARGDGNDLLAAYLGRGGVTGALANAAQEVFDKKLASEPEPLVRGVFLRLARLGEAGGATRRIARRDEFDDAGWRIVQRLAGTEVPDAEVGMTDRTLARLVAIAGGPGEETTEILHEALFTQWPTYARWLREWAPDKRNLDRLADDVAEWRKGGEAVRPLASGADLGVFRGLRDGAETGIWLSPDERAFVAKSEQAHNAAMEREEAQRAEVLRLSNARVDAERARTQEAAQAAKKARRLSAIAASAALLALLFAGGALYLRSKSEAAAEAERKARNEAVAAAQRAIENESFALASLSDVARREHRRADALRLAVASWPRHARDSRPQLRRAVVAMGLVIGEALEVLPPLRHEDGIFHVEFSADGTRVLTFSANEARVWDTASGAAISAGRRPVRGGGVAYGSDWTRMLTWSDTEVLQWDVASGAQLGAPLRHEGLVLFAEFSPDGTRVITALQDGTARVWDAASGAPLGAPMRHEGAARSAAFSRDGTRVLTWSASEARLWDAASGAPLGAPMRHEGTGRIDSARFSPDGTRVVTLSGNEARVWDAASGTAIGAPLQHEGTVWSTAFSRDGKRVVTASGNEARVWDAASGAPLGAPMRHEGAVRSAAFSRDGTRVLTWSDSEARVWDAASGAPLGAPMRHERRVGSALFSPDGTRVLTRSDSEARLWDAASGAPLGAPLRHEDLVWSAAFNPEGTRVVTASGNEARVWGLPRGPPIGAPLRHEGGVHSAAFSADGTRVVTASSDRTARVWDAASGAAIGAPLRHEGRDWAPAFSPDGTGVVTASADSTARVWDVASGAAIGAPLRHGGRVYSAEFSADGTRVVTASSDRTARVWDAASGAAIGAPLRHEGPVYSAAFSLDGTRVVTASDDRTAHVWDAASGAPIGEALRHEGEVISARFSPDGTRVVTASWDETARVWDAASGAAIGAPLRHEGEVISAAFSSDGTKMVTASRDRTARVWDAASGAAIGAPLQHEGPDNSAAFSADGTRVVTASRDGTARVWDAASGAPIGAPLRHEGLVRFAAFSRDGTRVVTASNDGTARVSDTYWLAGPIPHIACSLLPEIRAGGRSVDRAALKERYGIDIRDPICDPPTLPFDPARIDPR
jgi:WD40 repeat protein